MAWRQISDKPLSEPMSARFIDGYMRHKGGGGGGVVKGFPNKMMTQFTDNYIYQKTSMG